MSASASSNVMDELLEINKKMAIEVANTSKRMAQMEKKITQLSQHRQAPDSRLKTSSQPTTTVSNFEPLEETMKRNNKENSEFFEQVINTVYPTIAALTTDVQYSSTRQHKQLCQVTSRAGVGKEIPKSHSTRVVYTCKQNFVQKDDPDYTGPGVIRLVNGKLPCKCVVVAKITTKRQVSASCERF